MKMFGPHAPEAGSAAAFIKMLSRLRLFRRMFLKYGKFYFFMAVAANTGTRPFSFSITSYIKQYEPSLSGPLLSGFLVRLTPEAIKPDITEAISRAKENIRTICDQPLESLTYESTFGALEKASEDLHLGWGRIMHLDSVNDEPAQRGGHRGNAAGSGGFLLPPCR